MKIKLFLILLSFFLATVSVGQEISRPEILKFKIKSVTTIDSDGKIKYTEFYNDKGYFSKQASLNGNKQLHIDREHFYNDSSQLIEERTYTSSGEINTTSKFYYNDINQLSRKEFIQFDMVSATWIFEYNEKGNKVSEMQTSGTMGNSVTKYKYDDKDFLLQEDKSNNSIGKEERVNYRYSATGQIIEKKTKSYYFNTTITLTYYYNDADKLTKLLEKSSDVVSSTTIFDYDDKGLLASDTWESSISKTPHKKTYQIISD